MTTNRIHPATVGLAPGDRGAGFASPALPLAFREAGAAADEALVQRLAGKAAVTGMPAPELAGTGFTYRHNWGRLRGQWVLRLAWNAVNPRSRAFVAIGEGAGTGPDDGKFIGAARYTLHNVAPLAGSVDIWVNIEWSSDIPLYVDYLIVNP